MIRWPLRKGQPRPRIPARAGERVTRRYPEGQKESSEFWLGGECVGEAWWNPDGTPSRATGLRGGRKDGPCIEFHDHGGIYVDPYVAGLLHGLAKQYDARGRLLLVSPFRRDTGIDFWCDERGRLSEEHPLVDGKRSGIERWWNEDQRTVWEETGWLEGRWHGVYRCWDDGRLEPGYPRFYLRGQRVSRRAYLAAARRDPTLPAYRPEDDRPERPLPGRFVQLRERARHRGR